MTAVSTQIAAMADPFDRVNEDYDRLLTEQVKSFSDEAQKAVVAKNLTGDVKNYASFIKGESSKSLVAVDLTPTKVLRSKLLMDPENKDALLKLKDFYSKNDNPRLAAYYAGRLDNLKQAE